MLQEKLSFYKAQPLKEDWFAIFIHTYHAKLRTEEGKLQDISLFVAVGIYLEPVLFMPGWDGEGSGARGHLWGRREGFGCPAH